MTSRPEHPEGCRRGNHGWIIESACHREHWSELRSPLPAERDEPTGQEVVEANVSAFLDLQRLRQAAEDWRYSDELIGSRFRAWVAATRLSPPTDTGAER